MDGTRFELWVSIPALLRRGSAPGGGGGGAFDFESLGVMRPGDVDRDRGPPTTLQGDPGLRLGCD